MTPEGPSPTASTQPPPAAGEQRAARVLAVIAVVMAAVALVAAASWTRHHRQLVDLLEQAGLTDPQLLERVERERTPHHASLTAARSLIYAVLTSNPEDVEAHRRLVATLPEAADLAEGVLEAQPSDWQATMLLGAARYLEWSLARDARLYTEAEAWEKPMAKAVRDAAGHPEPRRLLATAYLETWHALSPEKRRLARDLLRRVFDDDLRAFEALAPAWFELGLDFESSLDVVPDHPDAWLSLERSFAQRRRWRAFMLAHQRRLAALESSLEEQRAEAELRLRLGNFYDARSLFLRLIQRAPPSSRFVPLVSRSLELYPPGLHGIGSTRQLEEWVDWSLELHRLGLDGLPPGAMSRLLDALVELEPPKAAWVAMAAEDLYQAGRYERLAQPLTLITWAPYLIAKARRLAERGDGEGAREALAQVALSARQGLPYLLAARAASTASGDLPAEAEARGQLDEQRRREWGTLDWRRLRGRPTLDFLPAAAASRLEIVILEAPAAGAVVEVRLDGGAVDLREVRPGDRLLLEAPLEARPHFLEIQPLAGGNVTPGDVRLR